MKPGQLAYETWREHFPSRSEFPDQSRELWAAIEEAVRADERAKMLAELQVWQNALRKACGDDERMVNDYVESQR